MTFHRAATGEYHCPVLFKPFTNTSHVAANKVSGNVYSYEVFMAEGLNFLGGSGLQVMYVCDQSLFLSQAIVKSIRNYVNHDK